MPTEVTQNTLNTRIKLRYDTYANWITTNPFLMEGEIAIAYVPEQSTYNTNNELTTKEPAFLIKVGTGIETTVVLNEGEPNEETVLASSFKALPVIQAKAADVYDWAKQAYGRAQDIVVADANENSELQDKNLENIINELYGLINDITGGNNTGLDDLEAAILRLDGAADVQNSVLNKIQTVVGTPPANTTIQAEIDTLLGDPENNIEGTINARIRTSTSDIREAIDTLKGSESADASRSVRQIAADVLTQALIPQNATASLDTLQEISAWIQSHPDDIASVNNSITGVQAKLAGLDLIETDLETGEEVVTPRTVKQYVDNKVSVETTDITTALTAQITSAVAPLYGDCLILDCGNAAKWKPMDPTESTEPTEP